MDLQQRLEKLECHFTWDLGSKNELLHLQRKLNNVDQEKCTWLVHYYNLLGYIQQTLGSNPEALMYLQKAESVIQEQGTEEAGVRLQVNKANLAWVYFHLGEMDKSKEYLEEVGSLQQMHPAPSGCTLHPEVSGEKGWTLIKFGKSEKRQAIDYFKMALKAQPDRKAWARGLAVAMSKAYTRSEFTPELEADILEQVKIASEIDPNDLFLLSLYILKRSEVQNENIDEEVQCLLERTLSTGNMAGLFFIFEYFKRISFERAIQEGQRVHEKFPTSTKVLKILADVYKAKVYSMKEDSQERQAYAQKGIELWEIILSLERVYPDCVIGRLVLATLHPYAHNIERADEIYRQLLSEEDDLPPQTQQLLYYSYSCYLFKHRQSRDQHINFLMKAAAIKNFSHYKQKCIQFLKKIVATGKNRRCEEISNFLKTVLQDE